MKTLLTAIVVLIGLVPKAVAEYSAYIYDFIANDRWYVYGGADSDGEDVYASTTLTIYKDGGQTASDYDCVPYTSFNEKDVALEFKPDELHEWTAVIAGTVATVNVISNWLEADTFNPKVYFKYNSGSCIYVEACNESGGASTPLCEQGQGYDGYTFSYGSAPCAQHLSGEYKASRRGSGDWKRSGQNIDVESGPVDCTVP